MRLRSISVKKLFGIFDHEIHLGNQDGVTIIFGPNGFGKTVMLRMIAAIHGDTDVFENTPFDEFSMKLEDGRIGVLRRTIEISSGGKPRVKLDSFKGTTTENLTPFLPAESPKIPQSILRQMDTFVPSPFRLLTDVWAAGAQHYTPREIIKLFPEAGSMLPPDFFPRDQIFDFSKELSVFFVETNRLAYAAERPRRPPNMPRYYVADEGLERPESRVKHYSDDIVQRSRTALTEYAGFSQERDRTFPERLVRFVRSGSQSLPESEILTRIADLEEKRRRLVRLGLLDSEQVLSDLTEDDVQRVQEALTIYVGDMDEKLRVFDDIQQRVGALMDIVNSRYKYKRLNLTREQGFKLFSNSGQPIDIEALSSGEQHELIVYYELLFRCPRGGLILIDEPEISLHAEWQARFLTDLIGILKHSEAYAIVATHSPMIIGPRRDLTSELKDPELSRGQVNA
jgi:predicted ATPase